MNKYEGENVIKVSLPFTAIPDGAGCVSISYWKTEDEAEIMQKFLEEFFGEGWGDGFRNCVELYVDVKTRKILNLYSAVDEVKSLMSEYYYDYQKELCEKTLEELESLKENG